MFESAGRDDLALVAYLNARQFSTKLPTNNPDKALAYCGLGSVFYNTEEYDWALRSFLKVLVLLDKYLFRQENIEKIVLV